MKWTESRNRKGGGKKRIAEDSRAKSPTQLSQLVSSIWGTSDRSFSAVNMRGDGAKKKKDLFHVKERKERERERERERESERGEKSGGLSK
jgi:hypothetical protein